MIIIVLILSILNFIGLLTAVVIYFKEKYTIVPIEEWNKIATVFNDAVLAGYVDEDNNFTTECQKRAAGGFGFFKDCVEEYLDEEEDSSAKYKDE